MKNVMKMMVVVMVGVFVNSAMANFDVNFEAFSAGERLAGNLHNSGWYERSDFGVGNGGILIGTDHPISPYTKTTSDEATVSGGGWKDTGSGMLVPEMTTGVYTFDIWGYENMDNLAQGRSYIQLGRNGSVSDNKISYTTVVQLMVEKWSSNYTAKVRLAGSGLPQNPVYVNTNDKPYHHYEITLDLDNNTASWRYQLSADGVNWDDWNTGDSGSATSSLAGIDTLGLGFSKYLSQNAQQDYSRFVMVPEPATLLVFIGGVVGLIRRR